jgi:hypothetical protein
VLIPEFPVSDKRLMPPIDRDLRAAGDGWAGDRPPLAIPPFLDRLAVQRLDRNGRWYVLPVEQVVYAFLGSAAALRAIRAPWLRDVHLHAGNVYVRTVRGLTVRTDFRQFAELEARLEPRSFLVVNRTLAVNMRRIVELDLDGRAKQAGVAVGEGTEWLTVSRRPLEPLLDRLGFRKRHIGTA